MVSTIDHFPESTQTSSNSVYNIGTFMYNSDRNDSLLCFSDDCYNANNGGSYSSDISVQGLGYSGNVQNIENELIALTLWYSETYSDNYVSTDTSPPDDTYTVQIDNGYIFKNNDENGTLLSVDLYYSEKYKDHATAATDDIKQLLVSLGYIFVATQGYIMDYNSQTQKLIPGTAPNMNSKSKNEKKKKNNINKDGNKNKKRFNGYENIGYGNTGDWQMGIANSYLSIPSGLIHETAIVEGSGINDAMIYQFGSQIQSLYQTNRVSGDDDIVTSKLGYWTDDGMGFLLVLMFFLFVIVFLFLGFVFVYFSYFCCFCCFRCLLLW